MRLALTLLVALFALADPSDALAAAPAGAPATPPPSGEARAGAPAASAIATLAAALAREVGPPADGRRALALAVEVRARALAAPLEAALSAALASQGYAVSPLRGPGDPEAAARAGRQDWLLRVQAGLVPGRRELGAVAELIPTWPSFFLQRRPGARAVPPRLVDARAPADAATLLLAREARPAGAPLAAVRRLARIPGRVLALAAGEVEEGRGPAIVAALRGAVVVLSPAGAPLAACDLAPDGAPVRVPAAALAVGDFGRGRVAVLEAGAPGGAVLAVEEGRLGIVAPLEAAPVCAGAAGPVFGAFVPGTSVLADVLGPLADPRAAPRSARTLYGAACAPRGGPIAVAALGTDLRLELLGADDLAGSSTSEPSGPPTPGAAPGRDGGSSAPVFLEGIGTGFALADLDGDGAVEVIASSADPAVPERVRVLPVRPGAPAVFESGPLEGAILSGAAADLTGDGADDAVLGAVVRLDDGSDATDLLLVTSDPRELP
jgi:hypothetical protein